jgi:hypothetical protein
MTAEVWFAMFFCVAYAGSLIWILVKSARK